MRFFMNTLSGIAMLAATGTVFAQTGLEDGKKLFTQVAAPAARYATRSSMPVRPVRSDRTGCIPSRKSDPQRNRLNAGVQNIERCGDLGTRNVRGGGGRQGKVSSNGGSAADLLCAAVDSGERLAYLVSAVWSDQARGFHAVAHENQGRP